MRESLRDFLIGLCAIIATAGLVAILFLFDEIDTGQSYTFTLRTSDSAGLRSGSEVTMNGVVAGKIAGVALVGDDRLPVALTLRIDKGIKIPRRVRFLVRDSLLGSSNRLSLVSEGWQPDESMIQPDSTVRVDELPSQVMTALGEQIDQRVGELLASWTSVGARIDALLDSDSADPGSLTGTLRQINDLLIATTAWVDSPIMRANVQDFLSKLPAMMDRSIAATEEISQLVRTAGEVSDSLMQEIGETGRQLRDLLHASTTLLEAMNQGEGTLGELVTNPDLYRSLEAAAQRLQQVLVDFQLMIQQIREEGVGPLL